MKYVYNAIDNMEDVIDTRDINDRIDYLSGEEEIDEDEQKELELLKTFREDHSGDLPEWDSGVSLIRDTFFEEYAQEFAEEIGAISHDTSWPAYYIDWERAARDLQQDYTSVEFDEVTYWGRA